MPSDALRDRLGHAFRRPELLAQALTHRSFGAAHNERLEFVGDAVLNCVVAAALYERFPDAARRRPVARARAASSTATRWRGSRAALELGGDIRLGEGELRSGGGERPSILADALEAVFGAVFVDGGFEAARAVIERVYAAGARAADPAALGKDPKTRLQEWLQARQHRGARVRGRPQSPARRTRRPSRSSAAIPALAVVDDRQRREPARRRAGGRRRRVRAGRRRAGRRARG